MQFKIQLEGKSSKNTEATIYLLNNEEKKNSIINKEVSEFDTIYKRMIEHKKDFDYTFAGNKLYIFVSAPKSEIESEINEKSRKTGSKISAIISSYKIQNVLISNFSENLNVLKSLIEGTVLANYRFEKYITDKDKHISKLKNIIIADENFSKKKALELQTLLESIYITRDLVNEPANYLSAEKLSEIIVKIGNDCGFKTEVFNKKKIESLKMGGLLAVNKGSLENPTFNIMVWKPKNAKNSKPFVLVGKGVTYDTGGTSLKPSASMQTMKCDMAGAATVVGLMYAIAKNKLPIHVVGLIPATDNKLDNKAIVPGDIITMYSGHTVEVLNTDAEGRLILADALHFAKKYDPELVIDFATLTGAAARAIGEYGSVVFQKDAQDAIQNLKTAGEITYERIVEFPLWQEYFDQITSDVADLKNIGGAEGGANSAAKFLEFFTEYPWIHIDIAGPSFLEKSVGYLVKGGTGVGVRLVYEFLNKQSK